ncbi:membrane-spanning 4-domains subfamily A member 4A-like isoform X1 [Engystomops pustulosus]|uniref:membrane-spanning 4-domains subfamily A member 4A-like isoform X1 n=1 Tax=Engystomops pustulosus TaxID=76066 RepID=UPI003AFAF0E1
MSAINTDGEGVVIISQERPKTDQVNVPEGLSYKALSTIPKPLVTFYKGEPEVLGTVQIFVGIIFISFGIIFWIMCKKICRYIINITYTRLLMWSGALYIISGSISLAASSKPTIRKVRASLVMHMISIAAASFEILMILTIFPSPLYIPRYIADDWFCAYYKTNMKCIGAFNTQVCIGGLIVFFFLLTLLIFCITISTSVFACRTVCRSSYNETSVIIYQSTPVISPEESPSATVTLDA